MAHVIRDNHGELFQLALLRLTLRCCEKEHVGPCFGDLDFK